jgi:hypothetical protein
MHNDILTASLEPQALSPRQILVLSQNITIWNNTMVFEERVWWALLTWLSKKSLYKTKS